eukprot:403351271
MHMKSRSYGGGSDFLSKTGYGVPYTTNYHLNGTGRDSYIACDNGGFYIRSEPSKAADLGTFMSTQPKFAHNYSRSIPQKYVFYTTNGSGRDSYISQNNGGFYPTQTVAAYKKHFFEQFRYYENRPSTKQYLARRSKSSYKFSRNGGSGESTGASPMQNKDVFLDSQGFVNHKHHLQMSLQYQQQLRMNKRLSQPKIANIQSANMSAYNSGSNNVNKGLSQNQSQTVSISQLSKDEQKGYDLSRGRNDQISYLNQQENAKNTQNLIDKLNFQDPRAKNLLSRTYSNSIARIQSIDQQQQNIPSQTLQSPYKDQIENQQQQSTQSQSDARIKIKHLLKNSINRNTINIGSTQTPRNIQQNALNNNDINDVYSPSPLQNKRKIQQQQTAKNFYNNKGGESLKKLGFNDKRYSLVEILKKSKMTIE